MRGGALSSTLKQKKEEYTYSLALMALQKQCEEDCALCLLLFWSLLRCCTHCRPAMHVSTRTTCIFYSIFFFESSKNVCTVVCAVSPVTCENLERCTVPKCMDECKARGLGYFVAYCHHNHNQDVQCSADISRSDKQDVPRV